MSVHETSPDALRTQTADSHTQAPASASAESRAERFARDLAELKIPDPAAARSALWLRLGGLLMLAGVVLGGLAYPLAHATDSALGQGDALALGLGGVCAAVVGAALFLRYSLTAFLRFWLARQSFDLAALGEQLARTTPEGAPLDGVPRTDPTPR